MIGAIAAHISAEIAFIFAGLLKVSQPIGPSISAIMRSVGEIMALSSKRLAKIDLARSPVQPPSSMRMAMVEIGIMRVAMSEPCMGMGMAVRLARRVAGLMHMAMMSVVNVAVLMRKRLVVMRMLVVLGEMEIEPDRHQHAGDEKRDRQRLAEEEDRDCGAGKRRDREIGCR